MSSYRGYTQLLFAQRMKRDIPAQLYPVNPSSHVHKPDVTLHSNPFRQASLLAAQWKAEIVTNKVLLTNQFDCDKCENSVRTVVITYQHSVLQSIPSHC